MVYLWLLLLLIPCFIFILIIFVSSKLPRFDYVEDFVYEDASDYPNLNVSYFTFPIRKVSVFAAKYEGKKKDKGYLLFAHGVGAGHLAYTSLINALCELGYIVLTFDMYGMGQSGGKNFKSLSQGAIILKDVYLSFLKVEPKLKDEKMTLLGHSYGAYSVITGLLTFPKKVVKEVVSFSTFNDERFLFDLLGKKNAFAAVLLLIKELFIHPRFLFTSVPQIMKKNKDVNFKVIHGLKDDVVNVKYAYKNIKKLERCKNVIYHLVEDRYHNPYLTKAAQDILVTDIHDVSLLSGEERKEKLQTIDWKKACQIDDLNLERWLSE